MPDEFHRLVQHASDRIKGVVVAIGTRENDNSKLHGALAPCNSQGRCSLAQEGLGACGAPGIRRQGIKPAARERAGKQTVSSDQKFASGRRLPSSYLPRDLLRGRDVWRDRADLPGVFADASSRRFLAAHPGLFTWRLRAMPRLSAGIFSVMVEPAAT